MKLNTFLASKLTTKMAERVLMKIWIHLGIVYKRNVVAYFLIDCVEDIFVRKDFTNLSYMVNNENKLMKKTGNSGKSCQQSNITFHSSVLRLFKSGCRYQIHKRADYQLHGRAHILLTGVFKIKDSIIQSKPQHH